MSFIDPITVTNDQINASGINSVPNWVANATVGTSAPSTGIALDASGNIDGINFVSGIENAATFVTAVEAYPATATEVGTAAAYTTALLAGNVNPAETIEIVGAYLLAPATIATTTTPATGSCAVQLQFSNFGADLVAILIGGRMYFSDVNGNPTSPTITSVVATLGSIVTGTSGITFDFTTNSRGQLQFTVTASASTYYISWICPTSSVPVTTTAIVCN